MWPICKRFWEEENREYENPKEDGGTDGERTPFNMEGLYNVLKTKLENDNKSIIRAYNEVKNLIGDFDFTDMTENEIYSKALKNENIEIRGNETLGELKAMFRVYNSLNRDIMAKAAMVSDSSFSFEVPSLYDI